MFILIVSLDISLHFFRLHNITMIFCSVSECVWLRLYAVCMRVCVCINICESGRCVCMSDESEPIQRRSVIHQCREVPENTIGKQPHFHRHAPQGFPRRRYCQTCCPHFFILLLLPSAEAFFYSLLQSSHDIKWRHSCH